MSTNENDRLLERASEAIDLASRYMEEFTSTTTGKVLDELVAQVTKHIDDDNLDDLFNASLPALERWLDQCSNVLAENAREAVYGFGLIDWDEVY